MTQKETSKDEPELPEPTGGVVSDPGQRPIEIDVHDESDRYHKKKLKSAATEQEP